MSEKIAVIYFSGYGHTKRIAETVALSAQAELIEIDNNGEISEHNWATLAEAKTIVLGAPTYMAGVPWQFKKFADASSKVWAAQGWTNKLFAGFSNSASFNGDKQTTLQFLQNLASQHGGIWISLGLLPSSNLAATQNDINYLGGSIGLITRSPADAGADKIAHGDIETAKLFGHRIAGITKRYQY